MHVRVRVRVHIHGHGILLSFFGKDIAYSYVDYNDVSSFISPIDDNVTAAVNAKGRRRVLGAIVKRLALHRESGGGGGVYCHVTSRLTVRKLVVAS